MKPLILTGLLWWIITYSLPLSASNQAMRIVSLDLCTDWMLLEYAGKNRHITYSPLLIRYSRAEIPDDLAVHDGSLEDIISLQPDLILSGEFNAIQLRKRLTQLGFNVEVLPLPTRLDGLSAYIQRLSDVLGVHIPDSEGNIETVEKNKTLLILGANGIGTGTHTLEHDMLTAAGWINYLTTEGYSTLELEELVMHPPDAIYWSAPQNQSLSSLFAEHPAISKIIKQNEFENSNHWRLQCPGPWTYDLIQEMALWND